MEVQFTVTVEMESVNGLPDPVVCDPLEALMLNSARQALGNALDHAQGEGFRHPMEEITSIMVQDVAPGVRVFNPMRRVHGEFLAENSGATLHCDSCGEQVQSNEKHTCPPLPDTYDVYPAPQVKGLRRLLYNAGAGVMHVHYLTSDYTQPTLSVMRDCELWGNQTFDPPRAWDPDFLQDGIESEIWSWLDPEEAWTESR